MKTLGYITGFSLTIVLISSLLACGGAAPTATPLATPTATPVPTAIPEPPGAVTGKAVFGDLTKGGKMEPIAGVLIALCRIGDQGLPEGPSVASANSAEEKEYICTLKGEPTALTDAGGAFSLEGVPPGDYLMLFRLFPPEVPDIEFRDIAVTEAMIDWEGNGITASDKPDFWESGGMAIAGGWSTAEGFEVIDEIACSKKYGLCLSFRGGIPSPVVVVASQQTTDVTLEQVYVPLDK